MDEWIIESENGKLWYGVGAWTDIRDKAKRYPSEDAANTEIGKFAMKGRPVPFRQDTESPTGDDPTGRDSNSSSE